jgi:hypothetical protein
MISPFHILPRGGRRSIYKRIAGAASRLRCAEAFCALFSVAKHGVSGIVDFIGGWPRRRPDRSADQPRLQVTTCWRSWFPV